MPAKDIAPETGQRQSEPVNFLCHLAVIFTVYRWITSHLCRGSPLSDASARSVKAFLITAAIKPTKSQLEGTRKIGYSQHMPSSQLEYCPTFLHSNGHCDISVDQ